MTMWHPKYLAWSLPCRAEECCNKWTGYSAFMVQHTSPLCSAMSPTMHTMTLRQHCGLRQSGGGSRAVRAQAVTIVFCCFLIAANTVNQPWCMDGAAYDKLPMFINTQIKSAWRCGQP